SVRHRPRAAFDGDGLAGHTRVYLANLLRLFGVFGYGRRPIVVVRRPIAIQLQFTLQGEKHHRLLASLAHNAVAVPARLSLRAARRQPTRQWAPLCESRDYDASRRTVARSVVDVRRMGRPPRCLSDDQPRLATPA